MKQKDGTSIRGEVLNVCAFIQELYSSTSGQNEASFMSNQNELPKITLQENKLPVKQMKRLKAPRLDEITTDVIRARGEQIYLQLEGLKPDTSRKKNLQ